MYVCMYVYIYISYDVFDLKNTNVDYVALSMMSQDMAAEKRFCYSMGTYQYAYSSIFRCNERDVAWKVWSLFSDV